MKDKRSIQSFIFMILIILALCGIYSLKADYSFTAKGNQKSPQDAGSPGACKQGSDRALSIIALMIKRDVREGRDHHFHL